MGQIGSCPQFEAQGITFIIKSHVIESLSYTWQDTQVFLSLQDRHPLSSCISCACQLLLSRPKMGQIGSCPQLEAQGFTFIKKCPVIESLSCIWQDTQIFWCLQDESLFSSWCSCACQSLLLQPKLGQIGSYPQFEAQGITFITKSPVIESLSFTWQDTQVFFSLQDRKPLISWISCACQ